MERQRSRGTIEEKVVRKSYKEKHIEWQLSEFSTIVETSDVNYVSPTFFINGIPWFLTLCPSSCSGFMNLYIKTDLSNRGYSLEYKFMLKLSDGNTEKLHHGILERKDRYDFKGYYAMKRSDILKRKSELFPENVLIIICITNYEIAQATEPIVSDETKPMKFERLDKLSANFKNLFGDEETCDTTLNVMDKVYKAHRSILIARSEVFAATFRHDTVERRTGVVNILDCDPNTFAVFLEYLYCGKIEEISVGIALNLYYMCDKYAVEELKTFCVEYLIQHLTEENLCEIVVFADKYEEKTLFSAVQHYFNENATKIFVTSEWKFLMYEEGDLAQKLLIEMSKVKLY